MELFPSGFRCWCS